MDIKHDGSINEASGYAEQGALLIERLFTTYREYNEKAYDQKQKRGFGRLFGKWISRQDPLVISQDNKEFLGAIASIVDELTSILASLEGSEPFLCSEYACKALEIMLSQKPSKGESEAEWYLIVAEYQSTALLGYASADDLARFRDRLLERTPKRLMLPKQREMLASMTTMIHKKETGQ